MKDYAVVPAEVAGRIYGHNSLQQVQFLAFFLQNIQIELAGRVAVVVLRDKDYAQYGVDRRDTENFVSQLLSIEGVQVAVFLDQQGGNIKGSLRSTSQWDMIRVAKIWGGGGHRCAAGFRIEKRTVDSFYPELLDQLRTFFARPC
jgi:phosphoesterase RecJ-like protein